MFGVYGVNFCAIFSVWDSMDKSMMVFPLYMHRFVPPIEEVIEAVVGPAPVIAGQCECGGSIIKSSVSKKMRCVKCGKIGRFGVQ